MTLFGSGKRPNESEALLIVGDATGHRLFGRHDRIVAKVALGLLAGGAVGDGQLADLVGSEERRE